MTVFVVVGVTVAADLLVLLHDFVWRARRPAQILKYSGCKTMFVVMSSFLFT